MTPESVSAFGERIPKCGSAILVNCAFKIHELEKGNPFCPSQKSTVNEPYGEGSNNLKLQKQFPDYEK